MSYITLNKKHFFHNLSLIAKQTGTKNKIAIVLKDNAYGHGLKEMATLAKEYGVLHAVVRNLKEAREIAPLFNTILVLADTVQEDIPKNVHLSINDIDALYTLKKSTKIELKFDTGMHRNGLTLDSLAEAFRIIKERSLELKGIFTHHRSADVLSSEFFWQNQQFKEIKKQALLELTTHKMPKIRFHTQNSAGTFRTSTSGDIVRIGISAFGLLEMPKAFGSFDFKPVLSLWAQNLHSFKSKAHHRHGYEAKGTISTDEKLSVFDIGYADGLLRLQDENTYTLPNQSQIIGRVSMDNIIVNSSDNELCIYHDARDYAKVAQTISYEVTTRLHAEIPRKIV